MMVSLIWTGGRHGGWSMLAPMFAKPEGESDQDHAEHQCLAPTHQVSTRAPISGAANRRRP